jgi:hypothetical protein
MKTINIQFTKEQLAAIDQALQQAPYYVAAPLIAHINHQIQKNFDAKIDAQDMPTGQTTPKDEFAGD